MRILFAGTPAVALPSLRALEQTHEVIGVLTREPAPVGRKRVLTPSPVHQAASEMGLDVFTPKSLKDGSFDDELGRLAPDAVAVVAYGMLVPRHLLQVPTHGWFNLHFSLLPRWRGASPVQAAIAAGDERTGISVFQIEEGLDTGAVIAQQSYPLDLSMTADLVLEQLATAGAQQLAGAMSEVAAGSAEFVPQVGETSYAPLIRSHDAQVDWSEPMESVRNKIHAYTSHPGAWSIYDGVRVKLGPVSLSQLVLPVGEFALQANRVFVGTATTAIELSTVAPAGKKAMDAASWLRGLRVESGQFTLPRAERA